MRSLLLLIVLIVLACGCARAPSAVDRGAEAAALWQILVAATSEAEREAYLEREVLAYVRDHDVLVERKEIFIEAVLAATERTNKGLPLNGEILENLHQSFANILQSVQVLSQIAARHAEWYHVHEQSCRDHGTAMPSDLVRMEGIALSAVASLALYDTFLINCRLVLNNEAVRKALNQGDSGLGVPEDQIDGIIRSYLSYAQRTRIYRLLRELREAGPWWETSIAPQVVWLRKSIAASPSGTVLSQTRRVPQGEALSSTTALVSSDFRELGDHLVSGVSKSFGNAIGAVAFRRGKLYGDAAIEEQVRSVLQPGDILLEKTPFRLTDNFIPGHWGHVAIWLGNEQQLRALGIWDDPALMVYHAAIQRGEAVVEALRDDVQLSPLARFLNIDDLSVLRCPDLTVTDRRALVLRSLRQLGKKYDFNFDVETIDRIVCSELVYQVYTQIDWPSDRAIGRWTISPDQVARRGLPGGPLTVIDLWHDGQRIVDQPMTTYSRLLKE